MRTTAFILHILGLLAVVAGLAVPWLALDTLADRADRLQRLESFLSGDGLPAFVREPLAERGYTPGLSPERLRELLSGGEDGAGPLFDLVAQRERLYVWDFWRAPAGGLLRLAGLFAAVAALMALVILIARRLAPDGPPAGQTAAAALGFLALGGAVLVILTAPQADTFGLFGSGDAPWGAAWLDVLTGAEVTVAPRALVPGGLLLLTVAQLLFYHHSESLPDADEFGRSDWSSTRPDRDDDPSWRGAGKNW